MRTIAEKASRTGGRSRRVRKAILSAAEILVVLDGGREPSMREIAEVAGVTVSTVSRRWHELQPEIQRIRYDRFYKVFDAIADAPELSDLPAWSAELETRLQRVASCLRDEPGAAVPISVLSELDELARTRLALAASQDGSSAETLVDRFVTPALHRSLISRLPI